MLFNLRYKYDSFIWSKDFEAMKVGKLAIRLWMSCPCNEITLMDLPSSVGKSDESSQPPLDDIIQILSKYGKVCKFAFLRNLNIY